jgi:glycosyltransferase involved in cell wall biosynthesis
MAQVDASYVRAADELERAAYHQMEHIFPIGCYVTENLVDHYGVESTRITPVGSGTSRVTPYHGEKDYRNGHILTVAKDRFEDKGGKLLLEAFQLARRTHPNLKLVVVGSRANARFVREPANVIVTGFVPDVELQRLFEGAALFAMPALNEPWGLVFLEALACKTPVLGLARNALPEMTANGRYGFLVNEATSGAVASALLEALGEPDRLRHMGIEGQAHCLRTYSWDAVAERIATRMLT